MKVLIKNQHGDVIDTIEDDDAETCEQHVGEAVGENIANELYARQIVDVVER
ncbi:MAG TPA: hypothetical protein VGK43_02670 [Solirubrobacterales bacterium]